MDSFSKFRLAGIVSVVSVCGVLATEIVGNVVGEYVIGQIEEWRSPELISAAETDDSVTLAVTPAATPLSPPPGTVIQAATSGAIPGQAVPPPPGAHAAPPPPPAPDHAAAPVPPPSQALPPVVVGPAPGYGPRYRGANRAALQRRAEKWRAMRSQRARKAWTPPRRQHW